MWDYVIGLANILGGIFLHALINGQLRRSDASLEYWSNWRAQHPAFTKWGPPFFVAFGALRVAFGLLG